MSTSRFPFPHNITKSYDILNGEHEVRLSYDFRIFLNVELNGVWVCFTWFQLKSHLALSKQKELSFAPQKTVGM